MFQCELCNESYSGECVRHFTVRSGEYIGISPLNNKRLQPRKDSADYHHLWNCSYSPAFEDFNVLCYKNKRYLSELKETLFIIGDRPSMSQNIRSTPLHLFDYVFVKLFAPLYGFLWSFFIYLHNFLDLRKKL